MALAALLLLAGMLHPDCVQGQPLPLPEAPTDPSALPPQAQDTTPAPAAATNSRPRKVVGPTAAAPINAQGPIVKEIEVVYVGPKIVAKSLVMANMRTTVGQPYSPAAVEEDVRNLYATGFFSNLRITDEPLADGVKVIVIVQPKPLVKEVVIEGNSKIKDKRIRKEIKIKIGDTLSEQQVAVDADKIKELYQTKGFDKVQVNYKTDINTDFGRAVVTFTITEGQKAYVSVIKFEGNKNISDKELRKQMKTKPKNMFSFFNKSGLFKDDQFKEDEKAIREYYQGKGYIDMQIKDVKYEYPTEKQMEVVISIFEGIQYHVGSVQIQGNQVFTVDQIRGRMRMLEGGIYSPQGLKTDVEHIKDLYGERGYIDANVVPERLANVESGKMDIVYTITEGPQAFVERLVIQGNNKTKDKVLRRESALAPGDIYDSVRADATKKRLENLGYFEKVNVAPQDTNVENRKNMVITVEEKRTGSVTFGIGFSSVDSILGFVELSQGNFDISNFPYFTGAGQKFRTKIQYGLTRQDFTLSFTEPWFMNQRLSLGFDLFAHQQDKYQDAEYNQRSVGGSVHLSKALGQFWTATVSYQLEEVDLYDFSDNASPQLLQEQGARSKSSISLGFTYDTRDDVFLTRHGEKLEIATEFAGGPLLGQTDIYKLSISGQKYWLFPKDIILLTAFSTGVADSYDDTTQVPIFDRYFVGGSRSVRGFDNREVGPRDDNNEPLGGQTYGYVNLETTFPIIDRVRGALFVDAGFNNAPAYDFDLGETFNIGAGFGLRMNLPIGPLRLDLGFPLKADKFNGGGPKFAFDVGYQF